MALMTPLDQLLEPQMQKRRRPPEPGEPTQSFELPNPFTPQQAPPSMPTPPPAMPSPIPPANPGSPYKTQSAPSGEGGDVPPVPPQQPPPAPAPPPQQPPPQNMAPPPGGGPDTQQPPGGTPPPQNPPAPPKGSFDDFVANYWAADRRDVLVKMLEQDYWAPDREAVIQRYRSMSDQELWPHGKPGQEKTPANPDMKNWTSQQWSQWFFDLVKGQNANPQTLGALEGKLKEVGIEVLRNASGQISGKIKLPNGQVIDVGRAFGAGGGGPDFWQWLEGGGGTYGDQGANDWEALLRKLVEELLNKKPTTYTKEQQDLIKTQFMDPLERQRQAARQQITERLAARGIGPGSGVLEQALMDVDRQYSQLETQGASQFSLNQIGLSDQRFNENEQRALSALGLLKQIPEYADQRTLLANTLLQSNKVDPIQLLQLLMNMQQNQSGIDQQNQQQNAAFWNQFIQSLLGLWK